MSPVFFITTWHFVRDHDLLYISPKYISYLSSPVKIFRWNLYLVKRETNYIFLYLPYELFAWIYQICQKNSLTLKLCYNHMHFLLKHHSTTFLSLFHHPLTYINPTILIDAILKVSTLQLLVISGSCVVYRHHTTQQSHHHHYNH